LKALFAILVILALFAIVVFFPSAWRPAFLALLLLVVSLAFILVIASFVAPSQSSVPVRRP